MTGKMEAMRVFSRESDKTNEPLCMMPGRETRRAACNFPQPALLIKKLK